MKLQSISLIACSILVASILPLINVSQGNISKEDLGSIDSSIKAAYKMDYVTGLVNVLRTKLGYSSSPEQAVVGRDGWLFLGDRYATSISSKRGAGVPSQEQMLNARKYRDHIAEYARSNGAVGTFFIIPPNKEDVYPENLPQWAKTQTQKNFSDLFLEELDGKVINPLPLLLDKKRETQLPLYFKTDSHWNDFGAWVAYRQMESFIGGELSGIEFLTDDDILINPSGHLRGGDIASFLFMRDLVEDINPTITFKNPVTIEIRDVNTDEVTYKGPNRPLLRQPEPVVITANNAKNKLRVLWLRDSFGNALSPMMAATFSDVIQQDWAAVFNNPDLLEKLISEQKPELVIFTIVGRSYADIVRKS